MCYDIKTQLESQLARARRNGDEIAILEITQKLAPYTDLPLFHASGFSHPKLLIYTNDSPYYPIIATWGLVPHWVKNKDQLKKLWNQTLNARGETIFEKPSFRTSAKYKRCIIYIDGFYEHHHQNKQTYPFFISKADGKPMALAGLWSEWVDTTTGEVLNSFSIVTTEGNEMLAKIHNNPKLSGPRMPLILPEALEDKWLQDIDDELDVKAINELIIPYPEEELKAYTVSKLRGKQYQGNIPEISEAVTYEELELQL
jgi:putative SOS response-associated peptidase YedK